MPRRKNLMPNLKLWFRLEACATAGSGREICSETAGREWGEGLLGRAVAVSDRGVRAVAAEEAAPWTRMAWARWRWRLAQAPGTLPAGLARRAAALGAAEAAMYAQVRAVAVSASGRNALARSWRPCGLWRRSGSRGLSRCEVPSRRRPAT